MMSKASGLFVRIEIRMGEGNRTDTPALGAAICDLVREGWHLQDYESGEEDREGYAVLSRSWDISVPSPPLDAEGGYAVMSEQEPA